MFHSSCFEFSFFMHTGGRTSTVGLKLQQWKFA